MIFIDTGAFVARFLAGDQYHSQAVPLWKQLFASNEPLHTSNFVVEETMHAHQIDRVFFFDRHFDLPGFTRIPLVPLVS